MIIIDFILGNCFLNFGNLSFQEITGISMGSIPAPFMANLFQCYYENKWLLHTKKRDLCKACLLSNNFGFIGNLGAIKDHLELGSKLIHKNIHTSELQLKKENISISEATFFDLSIIIENKKFKTQLYDKRDIFLFFYCLYAPLG